MIAIAERWSSVLLIFMCMYMCVSASNDDVSPTKRIFDKLGITINQEQFTTAVESTSRAMRSWELQDVVSAGSQFLQLWMEASKSKYASSSSSEARQHGGGYGGQMFDPVLGFALLGGIVLAALIGWLAYILASARRKRDLTSGAINVLSPDTTAQILDCITNAESSFACLACVAITGNGRKCFR